MNQLSAILRSLMTGVSGATSWTAADWLELWRDVGADDNRIAHGLRLILPLAPWREGVTVEIAGHPTPAQLFPDVLVHHPGGTATMIDLVAAARALMSSGRKTAAAQLSLF